MKTKEKYVYFTYNEILNGVFKSQVLDVIKTLRTLDEGIDIKLFSIVSPRVFFKTYKKLKKEENNSIVLPALAPLKYWWINKIWIFILKKIIVNKTVFCRGPIATSLILKNKCKVIYDGRGAVLAEHVEYGVFNNTGLENSIGKIERKAVEDSDGCIAVSSKLVNYWKDNFEYNLNKHQIIPCTVSAVEQSEMLPLDFQQFISDKNNQVIYSFAGGNGKWQGIDKILAFLENQFLNESNSCFVLLMPTNDTLEAFKNKHLNRVFMSLVKPNEVHHILSKCDYGIIFRENNITNNVSSPVKVAEYLSAGLKVLITPNVGDYSDDVVQHKLGYSVNDFKNYIQFNKPTINEKERLKSFAKENYSKKSANLMRRYLNF